MRTWLSGFLALACLPAGSGCAPAKTAREPGARPNIVLLIADDMDFEHLGFAGHPAVRTPNLDALASQGVVFTHGFVPMSRCRPAQASLLTGRWPHQTGITFNIGSETIDPADALPNHLARAGYATVGEGKFWEGDPRRMGFSNEAIVNYESFVREDQAHLFAFLDENAGRRPFFVWWAPALPHLPHDPPPRLLARVPRESIPVPPWIEDARREKYLEREQSLLAMVTWLDDGVGELVAKLRALEAFENTLFVFLIDNGWANGCVSKGWALDKGLRTPVIFTWTGAKGSTGAEDREAGSRYTDLVSSVDLYATILDYAGAPLPARCEGRSLRSRIEGGPGEPRRALYGALYPPIASVSPPDPARDAYGLWARTERWKYIVTLRDVRDHAAKGEGRGEDVYAVLASFERRRGERELYDLATDPEERINLVGRPEHAELQARLERETLDWWRSTGGAALELP